MLFPLYIKLKLIILDGSLRVARSSGVQTIALLIEKLMSELFELL
jgi:hypothetical protein